jgi:DNA-binding SARP family transcriptional activator/tetratricopeptide (TPR) repeat protein
MSNMSALRHVLPATPPPNAWPPGPAAMMSQGVAPRCRIRLLGSFAIEFAGGEIGSVALRRSHARRLLQMLASSPRTSEFRSRVLAALWPDFDEPRARNRLHHTVHGVRRALDELPAAYRPQIVVSADRVELAVAAGTTIDWIEFERLLDGDASDAAQRLAQLEQALALYRGDLALDWAGCADVDARRCRLAQRRDDAMREAVALAMELDQVAVALRHAHHRAALLQDDGAAHCDYALLLQRSGRADAALLHCRDVRSIVEAADPAAAAQIDETMRTIQQRANQQAATGEAPVSIALASVVSRQCVAAPRSALCGYDALLAACLPQLQDPYTSVLTLVGPPGAGKSLLAAHAAHRIQGEFRHGAVRVEAGSVASVGDLASELMAALEPLIGAAGDGESALVSALRAKELLVHVDGLPPQPDMARLIARLAAVNADVKWLVTARAPLHLAGERTLRVEPTLLLSPDNGGAGTAAAAIIAERAGLPWPPADRRMLRSIERLAAAVDGLPRALQLAAEQLEWLSPNELLARLDCDPAAVLRGMRESRAAQPDFAHSVSAWLAEAPAPVQSALRVLRCTSSWLSRADLQVLLGHAGHVGDAQELEALLECGVRHHYLLRRMRNRPDQAGTISEFRVPRIVRGALALQSGEADAAQADDEAARQVENWIEAGPPSKRADDTDSARGEGWFDERIDDAEHVIRRWQAAGQEPRLLAFCLRHARQWTLSRHPLRIVEWLDAALEQLPADAADERGRLLITRSRLRLRAGDPQRAFDDARQALAQLLAVPGSPLRLEALALIERQGSRAGGARSALPWCGKGIEAAESLLRVAQLGVRQGRFAQAMAVCDQCAELFAYFNVERGLSRTHLYRARIAFAMGNITLARHCAGEALQLSADGDAARAELMQAEIDLHELRFGQAIERSARVMTQADHACTPALVARAMQVAAWAHYGQGALPLARALASAFREHAGLAARTGLIVDADILSALVDARLGRSDEAICRVAGAVDLLSRERALASDIQSDLINAAELAIELRRPELAGRVLQMLQSFGDLPEHRLRPWVEARLDAVALPKHADAPCNTMPQQIDRNAATDMLKDLVSG